MEENNFIIIDTDTYNKWDMHLNNEKSLGEVLILSREVNPQERIGFESERAFILKDNDNLDKLVNFIDEKREVGCEINALYIHKRVLTGIKDQTEDSYCGIIRKLLATSNIIKIGIVSGGPLMDQLEECLGENVKIKSREDFDDKFDDNMGWELEI